MLATATTRSPTSGRTGSSSAAPNSWPPGPCRTATAAAATPTCTPRAGWTPTWASPPARAFPSATSPGMRQHITACAPHHRHFASGISDIFHVDETACRNPQAMVDIIKGAFAVGMRDFTFNLDSNEFIRITGYLVRKSDLVDIDTVGARHGSDYLAAGSERTFHLSERAVKRVGCHELDPRPGH
ncbi:MAG: glycyl radical enzyme domain-containing protein [Ilumatobacteraceae bacterium]